MPVLPPSELALIATWSIKASNIPSLEGDVGNYLEYDSNVHAVVDFYGPTDLSVFYDCPITKDRNLTSEQKKRVFGDVDNISHIFDLANPIKYSSEWFNSI